MHLRAMRDMPHLKKFKVTTYENHESELEEMRFKFVADAFVHCTTLLQVDTAEEDFGDGELAMLEWFRGESTPQPAPYVWNEWLTYPL